MQADNMTWQFAKHDVGKNPLEEKNTAYNLDFLARTFTL